MNCLQPRQMLRLAAGAVLFAAVATPLASAVSVKIVVPNRLDGVEGEGVTDVSNFGPFRQQQLNLASEFASLPGTHRTITGFYARPDFTVVQPSSATYADLVIKVSTTPISELGSVFENNYGAEVTTVFDGPLTISTQATGPPEGPRGFDYYVPFETPYFYDPAAGNLLVELASNSGPAGSLVIDRSNSSSALYIGAVGADASTGLVQNITGANQYEFVPEPSTCLLVMVGIAGLAWTRRRRR